jgi:cobalt-zinc-cadmium efflux system outer membrane protein
MDLVRLAVEQAKAELLLTKANWRPTVTAMGGYKRSGGYDALVAGVSVPLPLRNRNQGSREAAMARIEAAQAVMASTAAMVRAEVAAAARSYGVRRSQILDSLTPMLEHAAESSRIAEAAYREGGSDLLRLLDAQRLRIETETLYYEALAEFQQSVAELETAMGVAP